MVVEKGPRRQCGEPKKLSQVATVGGFWHLDIAAAPDVGVSVDEE